MNKNKVTNLSNDLVFHTYYKMDTNQKKILYYLISGLNTKEQDQFLPQSISLTRLLDLLDMGRSGKSYKELNDIIHDLGSKFLIYDSEIQERKHKFKNIIPWFMGVEFKRDEKKKIVAEFTFHPRMKPLLLHLKQFVQIPHYELMCLRSGYAIDLYIFFKATRDKTKKLTKHVSTIVFELGALRERLGVEPHQYKRYNDFKRKIILKGINEINEKSELLRIDFKEIREKYGRVWKVTKLEFFIYDKTPHVSADTKMAIAQLEKLTYSKYRAYQFLLKYGIYEDKAYEIVEKIKGSILEGFEDLFIEKAVQHFELKTKAIDQQKAATFVIWFFKGAFEVGTPEWSIFVEHIVNLQKQMEKEEPEKYENRLLAKDMPYKEFMEQVREK